MRMQHGGGGREFFGRQRSQCAFGRSEDPPILNSFRVWEGLASVPQGCTFTETAKTRNTMLCNSRKVQIRIPGKYMSE